MLFFYCYFIGGWYGSGATSMILQSLPTYKEQLVDYYGVSILLNREKLAGRAVFYWLYGGVSLFNNYKKMSRITTFFAGLKSFTFTTTASLLADQKITIYQTTVSVTLTLYYIIQN